MMEEGKIVLPNKSLVMFVGPPASGKSTLAKQITPTIGGIRWWDIDDIRETLFGRPVPNDGTDLMIKARDDREMAGTYIAMFGMLDAYLRAEHPLLLTCTLSSKKWGQDRVMAVCDKYPDAHVRIIWCWPEITFDQLVERMQGRATSGYVGGTTSPARAWNLRERYEPIVIPHLQLDTGPAKTPEWCAERVIEYISS